MNYLKCSRKTFLPFICLLTILTYGDIIPSAIKDYFVYAVWMIALVEAVFTCTKSISLVSVRYLLYGFGFLFGVFILEICNSQTYLSSPTLYSIVIALGIMMIGAMFGSKLTVEDVRIILRWYVLGAVILGIYIFVTNISTGFNLNSRQYININKNSVGQILSSAACIVIMSFNRYDIKRTTVVKGVIALFLIVLEFLIRSRTSLLCFAISLFVILFSRYSNTKAKRWILFTILLATIVIVFNPSLRETIIRSIILANRDATSLDAITSGRVTIYGSFGDLMNGKGLTGNGSRYYESFYLASIVQFGYIVGIYLDLYVLLMLNEVRIIAKKIQYGQLLFVIAISYSLNGVFEGLPPYGPGTKNFLLWLLFGMATTQLLKKIDQNRDNCNE